MPWKKLIKRDENVGLELTPTECKLLSSEVVFHDRHVEQAVRFTPQGEPVMLTLRDLDDLAGHLAREASHAKTDLVANTLSQVYERIERLLDLYAEDDAPAGRKKPQTVPNDLLGLLANGQTIVFPMPKWSGKKGQKYPIKMTPQQREAVLDRTSLRPGLRRKIEKAPEATQAVEFTRTELDELHGEIGQGIVHALSPQRKRLMSVLVKIEAVFERENSKAFKMAPPSMVKKPSKRTALIYQLKVTLIGIEPPVWRRVQVHHSSLGKLHEVIQVAMGWQDSHLHQFIIDGAYYGRPTLDDLSMDVEDENGILLSQIFAREKKARFVYEYDFGDSWQHEIVLERTLEPEPKVKYPRCLEGERACPPEDVGGVWGYADFLEAITDAKHENHREMKDWIGERFDPERFSVEAVNKLLPKT